MQICLQIIQDWPYLYLTELHKVVVEMCAFVKFRELDVVIVESSDLARLRHRL